MGLNSEILEITEDNIRMLESFIQGLHREKETFRYFSKRPYTIINNHLFTCLATVNDEAAGYGHLDEEDGIVWLGIVVKEAYQGKGVARKIMDALLDAGTRLGVELIRLSVDDSNFKARKLYERYGFSQISKRPGMVILEKKI